MMGSGGQGVSICFATLRACTLRLQTLNEIAWPIVPTGTIRFTLSGNSSCSTLPFSGSHGVASIRSGLLAEAELGCVAPHAVQDDGELAGDRDTSSRHAAVLAIFMP